MDKVVGALLLVNGLKSACRIAPLVRVPRAAVEVTTKECAPHATDYLGRVVVHLQELKDEPGAALSCPYSHTRPGFRAPIGGFPPILASFAPVVGVPRSVRISTEVQPLHAASMSGDVEPAGETSRVADVNDRVGIVRGATTRDRAGLAFLTSPSCTWTVSDEG